MYNLHPPLAAFPVALIPVQFFLELAVLISTRSKTINIFKNHFRYAAQINCLLTSVMLVAAFISGYQGYQFAENNHLIPEEVFEIHHTLGRLLLMVFLPCSVVRILLSFARHGIFCLLVLYWGLLLFSVALVVSTGYYGGELVFSYGAGVKVSTP